MPPLADLLIGGVLPGVIALVLLAAPWMIWRERAGAIVRWMAPVAVALAFVPAVIVTNKHAKLWPVNASERGLAVAAVGLVFAMLVVLLSRPSLAKKKWAWVGGMLAGALAGKFGALAVLIALHPHAVSTGMLLGVGVAAGVWASAATRLLARAERMSSGFTVPGMFALALFGSSLVMLFSAIGVYAQTTGGLVAAMTSAALVGLWKRQQILGQAAYIGPLGVLAYLLVGSWQLSANPPLGALVMAAMLPLVVAGAAMLTRRKSIARSIAAWSIVAALTFSAVGWAYSVYSSAKDASPYGY